MEVYLRQWGRRLRMSKCREFIGVKYLSSALDFKLNDEIIPEDIEEYEYAVIYYYDEIKFIKIDKSDFKINKEKLSELRLFSNAKEYYLLRTEKGFIGREIVDIEISPNDANAEFFDELQKVSRRFYPANDVAANEILFLKVRNYFNTSEELKTIDYRFAGVEKIDRKSAKEV